MTVTRRIRRRGEHEISRKTIARVMPGYSGGPVVTNSCVCFYHTRGCGCIGHPAFPAPSDFWANGFAKLGRIAPRERGVILEIGATPLQSACNRRGSGFPEKLLPPRGLARARPLCCALLAGGGRLLGGARSR